MLKLFRIVSVIEGISFLVILSVTLQLISREYVFVLGMFHGVMFLVYMMLSLSVSNRQGWSVVKWLALFMASVIPFAFILVELFIRKEEVTSSRSS